MPPLSVALRTQTATSLAGEIRDTLRDRWGTMGPSHLAEGVVPQGYSSIPISATKRLIGPSRTPNASASTPTKGAEHHTEAPRPMLTIRQLQPAPRGVSGLAIRLLTCASAPCKDES